MKNLFCFVYAFYVSWAGRRLNEKLARFKTNFFRELSGAVVEIGPGAGANITFLPVGVSRYIGIELNKYLRESLASIETRPELRIETLDGSAEKIPLPNAFADSVICTFVLCSVLDQKAVLSEVLRILKPGGSFLFIEHVAAHTRIPRFLQNLLTPFSRRFCGGCEWNRETVKAIKNAGFSHLRTPDPAGPIVNALWRPLGPVTFGKAVK